MITTKLGLSIVAALAIPLAVASGWAKSPKPATDVGIAAAERAPVATGNVLHALHAYPAL